MPSKKPPRWTDVYPQGTKIGNEEQKFFICLSRHKDYKWRSVSSLSKETKLTRLRVEEILSKYFKKGMVFQNPKNPDQWGYWDRVPEMLPPDKLSISNADKKKRIDNADKTS